MKKLLCLPLIIVTMVACDTSNQVVGNPDNTTNTSGTTGSANMTNAATTDSASRNLPGTPSDTAVTKKDSLPK